MTRAQVTPRREVTRQRLLTAAAEIFAERGMHGATVEDICEAAGFTRGAFYSNFADKEQLFSALLRQKEEELLARVHRVLAAEAGVPAPDGGDVIEQLVEKVLATQPMDRESHLVHAEFSLYAIRNPAAARELTVEGDRFRTELAELLEAGLARAGRRLSVAPADAVAVVIATFQVSMEQLLLRASTDRPDAGLARRTLPLVIRALSEPVRPD
jgi:AcrR family transcriptional regulator